MLVFLVLCACLRTLQGSPLLPPRTSFSFVDLIGRDSSVNPDCGGPQCRSVYSIVQSCLLTIFACVWTSLHPNISGPRDSDWTCFKRKVVMMLCVVIAPEMVLLWALQQCWAANDIAETYNKRFAKSHLAVPTERSLWGKIIGWFQSLWGEIVDRFQTLPEETTWREDGQPWTTTHGFYIQMGGFILYDDGRPKQVLDYKRFADLLEKKAIDAPTVTERDLLDRSKGDTISKTIVVLQTTWFGFQCVARAAQHLPLSELEVLTLAFAVMNIAIYAACLNKPQDVGMALCVPLKKGGENKVDDTTTHLGGEAPHAAQNPSQTDLARLPQSDSKHSIKSDKQSLQLPHEPEHDESAGEKHGWLGLWKESSPVGFLLHVPCRMALSILHPLKKMGDSDDINDNDLSVPMFYAWEGGDYSGKAIILMSCGTGVIFGAIHLLAWASEFPSARDRVLWRVSAIVMSTAPLLLLVVGFLDIMDMASTLEKHVIARYILRFVGYLTVLLFPFYVVGRFVVIVIALLAIHNPPRDILRDISWTSSIPHF